MLNYLFRHEIDVPQELINRERDCELLTMIPFNPETKYMVVAYRVEDGVEMDHTN